MDEDSAKRGRVQIYIQSTLVVKRRCLSAEQIRGGRRRRGRADRISSNLKLADHKECRAGEGKWTGMNGASMHLSRSSDLIVVGNWLLQRLSRTARGPNFSKAVARVGPQAARPGRLLAAVGPSGHYQPLD